MLEKNVSPESIKVYELYIQRLNKEYDLIWSRFKLYFGFISGVIIIEGYLIKEFLDKNCLNINNYVYKVIIILNIFGIVLSLFWLFVNINGNCWQKRIIRVIKNIEDALFIDQKYMLYTTIVPDKSKCKFFDVVNVNVILSILFIFVFTILCCISSKFLNPI